MNDAAREHYLKTGDPYYVPEPIEPDPTAVAIQEWKRWAHAQMIGAKYEQPRIERRMPVRELLSRED